MTAWWDPAFAVTLQGFKGGKVRKLACSRSHGCVARAGCSCREIYFGMFLGKRRGRIRSSPFFMVSLHAFAAANHPLHVLIIFLGFKHGQEGLLRDFDFAKLFHPLLAFFLLL